jgi:valyl-tRNA synthetase
MSKSKGTGLDPVALNKKYGTDAMRFCLASMAAPGTDIILSDDKLASARNFANKIWNAARFLFVNLDKFEQGGASLEELAAPEVRAKAPYGVNGIVPLIDASLFARLAATIRNFAHKIWNAVRSKASYAAGATVPLVDAWLFARLAATTEAVNEALKNYRFHEAAQSVYQFFWGDFCDWYIEWVKPELQSADRARAIVAWRNLFAAFESALRLLHPFMPFLTEELWHQLPQRPGAKSIALERYPAARTEWRNPQALRDFGQIQEVIVALRNIRAEMKLSDPRKKAAAEFSSVDEKMRCVIEANRDGIVRLAVLSELKISAGHLPQAGGSVRSTAQFDVRIAFEADRVDVAGESARLHKEIEGLEKAIASKEKQLGDSTFRSRAPEKIVRAMEATLTEQKLELQKLRKRLEELDQAA